MGAHFHHPLRRLFAGITEQTFLSSLGIGDPRVIDYVAALLSRFIHMDTIHRLKNAQGKRLEEVVDMVIEAEGMPPEGRTRREVHRHIGDFTLFWTGVYPDILKHCHAPYSKDHIIDYTEQGKRSYYIASTFADEPFHEEAPVLRRLSEQFELFAFGLSQVRQEWERQPPSQDGLQLLD